MGLSCSCYEWDGEGWSYEIPSDYATAPTTRRRRCCSCREQIDLGATAVEFRRHRGPNTDIEERIYGEGDSVPLASWWMCERCGDLFFSLSELGFCVTLGEDDMRDLVREYAAVYGKAEALRHD